MTWRPVYRRDGYILALCTGCARLHYVEPHGTTARCPRCRQDTEHVNIPQDKRCGQGFFVACKGDQLA